MLPADELREVTAAANQTAATMAATANEVVSMERAMQPPRSRVPTWRRPSARSPLSSDHGARQYNEMVTAAAQLVSAANRSMSSSRCRRTATVGQRDRPAAGWAQAFDELDTARRLELVRRSHRRA